MPPAPLDYNNFEYDPSEEVTSLVVDMGMGFTKV